MTMHPDAAMLHAVDIYRDRWILLGFELRDDRPCPVFECPCNRQRYTLVTLGAKLPDVCPKCNQARQQPYEAIVAAAAVRAREFFGVRS